LQVPTVIDGHEVIRACRDSGGSGYVVSDQQVWEAQKRLAREEGVFCEPAGAVSVAGVLTARELGEIDEEDVVVCLITGSGFKDSPSIDRMLDDCVCPILTEEETAALR
jgi:threonine synthase